MRPIACGAADKGRRRDSQGARGSRLRIGVLSGLSDMSHLRHHPKGDGSWAMTGSVVALRRMGGPRYL
ncbi:hypothetical protein CDV49_11640 [Haematobacter genomosp. 1]|uniref:Uncharacterized protein n=1 Tax=Haematobacter genomosp. 1 TaxID=366618 RepID=A0A212AAK8_9RHOB|nr:hypothetical protein CDV49_11640 [Haematobacter genomosp. 1]